MKAYIKVSNDEDSCISQCIGKACQTFTGSNIEYTLHNAETKPVSALISAMKALVASLREIFRSSGEYIEKNPAKEAMINVQVSKESVFESLLQVKV